MADPAVVAQQQLELCRKRERRLHRQIDASDTTMAELKVQLSRCRLQITAQEESGAEDSSERCDRLYAQEEVMENDLREQQTLKAKWLEELDKILTEIVTASTALQSSEAHTVGSQGPPCALRAICL